MARYVVGIDLGTTNSAIAFAPVQESEPSLAPPRALPITQVVAAGEAAERSVLPSFLYLPSEKEFAAGVLDLPWKRKGPERLIGTFARDHGARVPARLVSSAKSWLCHPDADRRASILPWSAPEGVPRVSPVEAASLYLAHLRDAWNHAIAGRSAEERLERQDIMLTVPASFDASARELTVEAASAAGLENVTLIEEPQAAFYAWLAARGDTWRDAVKVGDRLLVCDVGGGTTDFALIEAKDREGDLELERVAVGDHILLGGDNMDLALAHATAATLPGGMNGLDSTQRIALVHACRAAKEALFRDPKRQSAPVAVLGRGSKVVGGSVKTELARSLLERVTVDGFFPRCDRDAQPQRGRRVGLTEIGLPFASEPAVTKHLAAFLTRHASEGAVSGMLAAILFNGGVFQAAPLRDRVLEVVSAWAGASVPALDAADLDLAVAQGAAYYGLVRRGKGVRIRGGVARAYYIGIETSAPAVPGIPPPIKAVCVVPMGMEEGTRTEVPGPFIGLVVGQPAEFRFLGSTVRKEDAVGQTIERFSPDELEELHPIEAELPAEGAMRLGQTVPVRLESHVTPVGTLELWCQHTQGPERWKLELNVRESPEKKSENAS